MVDPRFRRRVGATRRLCGLPVHARKRVRPRRSLASATRPPPALRRLRAPDPRRQPARVRAPRRAPGRSRTRSSRSAGSAPVAVPRNRGRRSARARAPQDVPGPRHLPLLGPGVPRRDGLLRARDRLDVGSRKRTGPSLDVHRLLRRLHGRVRVRLADRREHRAASVRRGADRDPDAHAPPLASAARLRGRARTCPLVESDAARRQLRPQRRRSHRARRVLEADDLLPPGPRAALVSRRGGRHARSLARRFSRPRADPARARLVQAGGLSAEPRAVREARDRPST